jgi:iron(III) transport system ATP-binding protein
VSAPVPAVRLAGVRKSFAGTVAVDDVSLELEPGTIMAILGPSGCGKTTCLRLIAGFERPDAGSVEIGGRRVASPTSMVPPERRRVGFVFQNLALFPHLAVRDNVAFGIRRDPDRGVRTDELLELVGLAADAERFPHQLSGGMQQRVALARALAPRPDVLLLDEPFSSLDRVMRTQLRGEVREILRGARQSAIFVTHDQGEALTVADRVAVMTGGRILQVAPPELIYAEPATPFVATFVGVANLVHAEVQGSIAHTRFGNVRLIGPTSSRRPGAALCLLRPEHFAVVEAPDGPASRDAWEVTRRSFSGSEILIEARSGDGERIWVEVGDRVRHLGIGDRVELRLRDVETVVFGRVARDGDAHASAGAVAPGPAREARIGTESSPPMAHTADAAPVAAEAEPGAAESRTRRSLRGSGRAGGPTAS